jgi:hypothetical protein
VLTNEGDSGREFCFITVHPEDSNETDNKVGQAYALSIDHTVQVAEILIGAMKRIPMSEKRWEDPQILEFLPDFRKGTDNIDEKNSVFGLLSDVLS